MPDLSVHLNPCNGSNLSADEGELYNSLHDPGYILNSSGGDDEADNYESETESDSLHALSKKIDRQR